MEEVKAAIMLAEYLRKDSDRRNRKRLFKKATAIATLPLGGGLMFADTIFDGGRKD